jgi:Cu/Ag efflux pump CusA
MFSRSHIIAAYLPIFLLERVEGRIFAPMANTVVAALIVGATLLLDAHPGARDALLP